MNRPELSGICPALNSLLQHELGRGNRILSVDTGWSKVKLAIRLEKPLDMGFIRQAVADNPDLEIWESRDIKNPQEAGVLCKSARQTLSGQI